ncbi:MAG: hypothetical protein GY940_30885 [bacterium]|nr:hypothetical protein [bacterium]
MMNKNCSFSRESPGFPKVNECSQEAKFDKERLGIETTLFDKDWIEE